MKTKYHLITEVEPLATRNETPDHVGIELDRDDAWDLLEVILRYLHYDPKETKLRLGWPCTLKTLNNG